MFCLLFKWPKIFVLLLLKVIVLIVACTGDKGSS